MHSVLFDFDGGSRVLFQKWDGAFRSALSLIGIANCFEHLRTDLRLLREIVLNAGSTAVEEFSRADIFALCFEGVRRGKDVDEKSGDLFGAISAFEVRSASSAILCAAST